MQFRVLGNLEVAADDGRRIVLPPKLRTILALLLIQHDQVVSIARIVEELWPSGHPATALATVQTYIYQLRKLLGSGGRGGGGGNSLLVTEGAGYTLRVPSENIDCAVFGDLIRSAQSSFTGGEYDAAARALNSALALWRASVFSDVPAGPFLDAQAVQLEEIRLQGIELQAEVYLRQGRHLEAVRDLKAMTITHPLHEGFHAKLMLALHRSGRRHEALDAYAALRQILSRDLGVEPSASVQEVHRAILAAGSGYDDFEFGAMAGPSQVIVPAQLPPDTADFVGRDDLLAELRRIVVGSRADVARAVCLVGAAGTGKTVLATKFAHPVRRIFTDGQFFAGLRDESGQAVNPYSVLGEFLEAAGFASNQIPSTVEARSRLFRSWCADRNVLVVLDDAVTADQVRPLLPGGVRDGVVITSRAPLYGLSGVTAVEVTTLPEQDALALLVKTSGRVWKPSERNIARDLVELCGHLPLAVRAVGAKLARSPHLSPGRLRDRLIDPAGRLDELKVGDLDVRARIDRSYRGLGRPARTALEKLGASAEGAFTVDEAAMLLEVGAGEAESILDGLVDERLLVVADDGAGGHRYVLPELTRLFMRGQVRVPRARRIASERWAPVTRLDVDHSPPADLFTER
ncbi:BTAD domain-containing putative transcriptional regulator [Amycolatopsis japonica]